MPIVLGFSADLFFEPAMQNVLPGSFAFAGWIGTGSGAGMAILFALSSLLMIALAIFGALHPALRNIDQPDIYQTKAHEMDVSVIHTNPQTLLS